MRFLLTLAAFLSILVGPHRALGQLTSSQNQFLTGDQNTHHFSSVVLGEDSEVYGAWNYFSESSENGVVKFARWDGMNWTELGGAELTGQQLGGQLPQADIVNQFGSDAMKVDSSGDLHIVLSAVEASGDSSARRHLVYGRFDVSDSSWEFSNVLNFGDSQGRWNLLNGGQVLLLDSMGRPHLIYGFDDRVNGEARIEHAYLDGINWVNTYDTSDEVDSVTGGSGISGIDAVMDRDDNIHVSYVKEDADKTSGDLWYARSDGTSWVTPAVEIVDTDDQKGTSIALDSEGDVHVGYAQITASSEFTFRVVSNVSGSFVPEDAGTVNVTGATAFFGPVTVNLSINDDDQRVVSGSFGAYDSELQPIEEKVVVSSETLPGVWVVEDAIVGGTSAAHFGIGTPEGSMVLTDEFTVFVLQGVRSGGFTGGNLQYAAGVPEVLDAANFPVIGVSQVVSVNGDTATFDFYLENLGPVEIGSLSLPFDLSSLFGSGAYLVSGNPLLVDDPGTIALNSMFDGAGTTELIATGSTLAAGDTAQIRVVALVSRLVDTGGGLGSYTSQVTASGQAPTGRLSTDSSDNGTDPDPNGNGDPTEAGENDASVFTIAERPVVGVAESVSVSGDVVTFDFFLENFGNVDLQALVLPIDLDGLFGAGRYAITTPPALISDPGTINLNGSFDGASDIHLLAAGSGLPYSGTAQVRVVVEVDKLIDGGEGLGVYSSQVSTTAQAPNGTPIMDASDNGSDPDPNSNGTPGETGEDDPTPFAIAQRPAIGISQNVGVYGRQLTFDVYLENFGNVAITDISVPVDLDAVLGAGNYSVSSGPSLIDDPGTLTLNGSFNGSGNQDIFSPASSFLAFEETAQIRFVVDVTTVTDQGSGLGVFSTQVTASGQSQDGTTTSDLSDSGTDPDPNGNGDPGDAGEDDPGTAELRGTIGDLVWNDLNGDGNRDAEEPGLAGVTVYLDLNSNGVFDAGEPSDTSSGDGAFDIADVPADSYQVRFAESTVPLGYIQTGGGAPTEVTLFAGEDFDEADLGFSLPETPSLTVNSIGDDEDRFDEEITLREALEYAATLGATQEITFSDGTGGSVDFTDDVAETIVLGGTELTIASDVTITGPGAGKLTVSGDEASRVFLVQSGTTSAISGLTIADGSADSGAGISTQGSLTISDVVIAGNQASTSGAGVNVPSPGSLHVRRTTIRENTASILGGGIANSGPVVILDCTIQGNSASGPGGGIYSGGDLLQIINSTISDNEADNGGGIYVGGVTALTNATLSENRALNEGGGIFAVLGFSMENSIVANSTNGDVIGDQGMFPVIDATHCLIEDGLGEINGTNVNNLSGDPMLGPLQDNGGPVSTHGLLEGSPAVDAGDNALAVDENDDPLATDQRGFSRLLQGNLATGSPVVDLGAYELFAAPTFTDDMPSLTVGDEPIDLSSAVGPIPSGGVFSGIGVSGGLFDPAGLEAGEYSITYTVTDGFGGTNRSTFLLTLAESPSLVVTTPSDVVDNIDSLTSLREAVAYAATLMEASEITFSDGTGGTVDFTDGFAETITVGAGEISIESDLTISGPGTDNLMVSGGGVSRIFVIAPDVAVHLSGIALVNGSAGSGGAVFNAGNLSVSHSELRDNVASSDHGGAILTEGGGHLTLIASTVSGNTASGTGGGILFAGTGELKVVNSTISGNGATRGGGVDLAGTASIINSTIAGNTASGDGGGIHIDAGTLSLNNSLVADSTGGDLSNPGSGIVDATHSLIEDGLAAVNGIELGNLSGDPLLGPLRDNGGATFSHALLFGSPAIDAGDNLLAVDAMGLPLADDQRGQVRVQQGLASSAAATVDIGAFELFAFPILIDSPRMVEIAGEPIDLAAWFEPLPPGGGFNGPGVVNGIFYPALAGAGVHEIIYTFIDEFGVSNQSEATLEVFIPSYRPDLRVGAKSNPMQHDGDDVYGGGQNYRDKTSKRSARLFFSVENDGNVQDTLRSVAVGLSKREFRVRILSRNGAGNVTAEFLAAGFAGVFGSGEIQSFKTVIRPGKKTRDKASLRMQIQARSQMQPGSFDAADVRIKFKRLSRPER